MTFRAFELIAGLLIELFQFYSLITVLLILLEFTVLQ